MSNKPTEKIIHQQICDYLKLQYPNVIFTSDPSGARVSIGLRVEFKRKRCASYKIPDLLILQPNKEYKGLFLEVKRSANDLKTKKGDYKKSKHIEEQLKSIAKLIDLGYFAAFACGFEDAKNIIDGYMKMV